MKRSPAPTMASSGRSMRRQRGPVVEAVARLPATGAAVAHEVAHVAGRLVVAAVAQAARGQAADDAADHAHELDAGAALQRVDGARAPARVGDVDGEQHERRRRRRRRGATGGRARRGRRGCGRRRPAAATGSARARRRRAWARRARRDRRSPSRRLRRRAGRSCRGRADRRRRRRCRARRACETRPRPRGRSRVRRSTIMAWLTTATATGARATADDLAVEHPAVGAGDGERLARGGEAIDHELRLITVSVGLRAQRLTLPRRPVMNFQKFLKVRERTTGHASTGGAGSNHRAIGRGSAPRPRPRRPPSARLGALKLLVGDIVTDVENGLPALADGGPGLAGRAARHLVGAGGKRVRPLLVILSARAAGDRRRLRRHARLADQAGAGGRAGARGHAACTTTCSTTGARGAACRRRASCGATQPRCSAATSCSSARSS